MRKPFFSSSLKKIDEELEEIKLSDFILDLGPILPGEEVIGDLSEFERRVFIWHELVAEEIRSVFAQVHNEVFYSDQRAMDQCKKELELITAKSELLMGRVVASLAQRFKDLSTNKSLAFRGNFQIVLSNETIEDMMASMEALKKAVHLEFLSVRKRTGSQNN